MPLIMMTIGDEGAPSDQLLLSLTNSLLLLSSYPAFSGSSLEPNLLVLSRRAVPLKAPLSFYMFLIAFQTFLFKISMDALNLEERIPSPYRYRRSVTSLFVVTKDYK